MAEFVRIWDEKIENVDGTFGNYIEYDTTTVITETVGVPVTPVGFSRDVNVGIIQKVIDTNDIIAGTQSVEISQIFRPVTVEKSDANRFSIQTALSKQVSVEAKRNDIIVNLSGIGQRGVRGATGADSIRTFDSSSLYARGEIVSFDGENWTVRIDLNGAIATLDDPAENSLWTKIADHRYIQDLPLTSGYEVGNQADWDLLEPVIEFGDIIKVSNILESDASKLEIQLFNETEPFLISESGGPLQDSDGHQFFVTGNRTSSIIVQGTDGYDIVVADFLDALDRSNIVFGEDAFTGSNSFIQVGDNFGESNPGVFQILSVVQENTTAGNFALQVSVASESGQSVFVSAGGVDQLSSKLYGTILPGIEISQDIDDLKVGNLVYIQGELEDTIQEILRIAKIGNKTYLDILDYTGFDVGDFVVGRLLTSQTLDAGQWYARNKNIRDDLNKLDSLATDLVLSSEVSTLSSHADGVTDPSFINSFTRSRAESYFGLNSNTSNPQRFETNDQFRIKALYNRLFGGSGNSENGTGYSPSSLGSILGTYYSGIQDGAQINVVKSVDESGVLDLSGAGRLSTEAEKNVIQTYDTSKFSVVTETAIDSTTGEEVTTADRELRTTTQRNQIESVEPNDVLSVVTMFDDSDLTNIIDIDRQLRSKAEVNIIRNIADDETDSNDIVTQANTLQKKSITTIDGDVSFEIFSEADKNLPTSTTGGSVDDGTGTLVPEANKLILLDSNGLIPSTSIGKINLSNVQVFNLIENRNAERTAANLWSEGDLAIVTGIPDLTLSTALVDGGNSLVLNDTTKLYVPGSGSGDTSRVFLSSGGNFKEFEYSANDTATNTLTVVSAFDADDATDFSVGAKATVQTGTFIYFVSGGQMVAGATVNDDWAELVPTTGVVTSINQESGVVTLSGGNVRGVVTDGSNTTADSLNGLLSGLSVRITGNDGDINTISGSTTADGVTTVNSLKEKQDKLVFINNETADIVDGGEKSVRAKDLFTSLGLVTGETGLSFDSPTSGSTKLVKSGVLFTEFSGKQKTLVKGTGIELQDSGDGTTTTISVGNTSGVQVTVFSFKRTDGDTVRMTKYEDGDTIKVEDLKDTHILVDGLNTELYNIEGACNFTDSFGNEITNAQECEEIAGAKWTIKNGPAILQRIT